MPVTFLSQTTTRKGDGSSESHRGRRDRGIRRRSQAKDRLAAEGEGSRPDRISHARIFRYFKTSPQIIRLAVMMVVRYPLSLRNVEDLMHERGMALSDGKSNYGLSGQSNSGLMRGVERKKAAALPEMP
ncbi:MAG: hypothetical protein O9308_14345 [Beijerinckiaceae bacterium]|nr:hypothetical protein [Beijerinckiaceae bacterium]